MYLLFLDDSSKASDSLFGFGGVAISAADWDDAKSIWDGVLAAHDWPHTTELKWHGIRSGDVSPALADAVYAGLAAAPITCFAAILRPHEGRAVAPELFADDEETYATGLMFACELFQRFLIERDEYGVIVADMRWRDADDRLRRFFERLQEVGTPYVKIERIVDGLMMSPSHHSLGLMLADLVIGTTLGAERGQEEATGWLAGLGPRFAATADGEIEGTGLIRFPPADAADVRAPQLRTARR